MTSSPTSVSRRTTVLALAGALALPATLAAWILAGPADDAPGGRPVEPDVFETEMALYDWSEIRAGDWVEHVVATSSRVDASTRVRTRLACVAVDGGTAWVEGRDHLVGRFFPGASVLYEVRRSSGRIVRAWWGVPGRGAKPVEVRRLEVKPAIGAVVGRRAHGEESSLSAAGVVLGCVKAVVQERPEGAEWTTRSTIWLSPEVPFPRRVSVAADGDEILWTGPVAHGGVVREEYSGLAVRLTMEVAAWGHDARQTIWPEGAASR